jgi:3-oxoacyl-[acyl-carrier-protein] synthase II
MLNVPTKVGALSNSCTGGLDAIASAYKMLKNGEAEIAFAGGTDAVIIPSVITGLGYAGLLSTAEDHPESASRPFDHHRTGGFLGEGAGVVVLENLEHALARGATPYAEIVGFETVCDYTEVLNLGFEKSMQGALQNAGYMPSDISYINAHGSSDPTLDQMEAASIAKVFKEHAEVIPVTSIKGVTGNPLAAAGAIQTISACQSFRENTIFPIANLVTPGPMCDLDFVMSNARKYFMKTCMINSRGIGGVNSSLILRNYP